MKYIRTNFTLYAVSLQIKQHFWKRTAFGLHNRLMKFGHFLSFFIVSVCVCVLLCRLKSASVCVFRGGASLLISWQAYVCMFFCVL